MKTTLIVIALMGFTFGCGAENTPDADPEADTGMDVIEDVQSDTDVSLPPLTKRTLISTNIETVCPGCVDVSICERLPMSHTSVVSLTPFLTNDNVHTSATVSAELVARELPLGTCRMLTPAELDAHVMPLNVTCLDGGDMSVRADTALLQDPPITAEYRAGFCYSANVRLVEEAFPYVAGITMELISEGGADVAPFTMSDMTPEAFQLRSPHVDGSGQIQDTRFDVPLPITWTGADSFDEVLITLQAQYCLNGPRTTVACRVENSGAFQAPLDVITELDGFALVEITLAASREQAIPAPDLTGTALWSVGSRIKLAIFHDLSITPPPATCESESMSTGSVGVACDANAACGGGCCLEGQPDGLFAGGYCTLLGCEADTECPSDAACIEQSNPFYEIPNYCAKRCSSDDDCRGEMPEYHCGAFPGGPDVCLPGIWGE